MLAHHRAASSPNPDLHGGPEEDQVGRVQALARDGLGKVGHHGVVSAMGVPRSELPHWKDIQIVTRRAAATSPMTRRRARGLTRASR